MPVLDELLRKAKMETAPKPTAPPAPAASADPTGERILVDSYGEASIYKAKGEPLLLYEVPVPRYRGEEHGLIDSILDVAARVINVDEALFETKADARDRYVARVLEIIDAYPELKIPANSKEFYAKAVVREMVGFGLLDPLVSDDGLEEVMVIGTGKPVYVFHRKYEMMKTNIVFYDDKDVTDLVDRIARNIGRRIDLQSPLLDARLPNGTRVNATLEPVSLNGATITLRKFRTDPISIIDLINNNTMSYEVAAFLWLISEGMGAMPANLIIAGGTASGKCMVGCTPVVLADGRVMKIADIVEGALGRGKPFTDNDGWDFVHGDGTKVLSLNQESLKITPALVKSFWRHKAPEKLVRVKTRTGREITVTCEHPFFTFEGGRLVKKRADELRKNTRIAVPKKHPIGNRLGAGQVDVLPLLYSSELYLEGQGNLVRQMIHALKTRFNYASIKDLGKAIGVEHRTLYQWMEGSAAVPLNRFMDLLNSSGVAFTDKKLLLKSKTSGKNLAFSRYVTPELMRFLGLVLADGHLDRKYAEFHNQRPELLEDFLNLAGTIFGSTGSIQNYPGQTVPRARVNSTAMVILLKQLFGVPVGNKSAKISLPDLIFSLPDEFVSELLSGLYDCDSSFTHRNKIGQEGNARIEYSTKSKALAGQLPFLLLRFAIPSHAIRSPSGHYRIMIYGRKNCSDFGSAINLRNHSKQEILSFIRESTSTFGQIDLYPGIGSLLTEARLGSGLTQKKLAERTGLSRRAIGLYEANARAAGRGSFQKLVTALNMTELKKFAGSEVFFDEIKEISAVENHGEKFVYDFTVEDNHTFIAGSGGGVIAHNTTTLNSITSFVPNYERLISIEDIAEIKLPFEHWVRFEVRPPGVEGTGEIDANTLLKNALRMRPDRIIIGEIRGEEAYTLFSAMNTGHRGVCGTLHSNSARETISRLTSPPMAVPTIMLSALNFIVMQQRVYDRRKGLIRRVSEVAELVPSEPGAMPSMQVLYEWDPVKDELSPTGSQSTYLQMLAKYAGGTREGVLAELHAREAVLRGLNAKGVRELAEVCRVTQNYALKKQGKA